MLFFTEKKNYLLKTNKKINSKGINLANKKSTEKRIRQNEKSRKRNFQEKSAVRTAAKKVAKAITDSSESQEIKDNFKQFVKKIDTAVRKGVIHKRTAARKKSRIAKRINKSAVKSN